MLRGYGYHSLGLAAIELELRECHHLAFVKTAVNDASPSALGVPLLSNSVSSVAERMRINSQNWGRHCSCDSGEFHAAADRNTLNVTGLCRKIAFAS